MAGRAMLPPAGNFRHRPQVPTYFSDTALVAVSAVPSPLLAVKHLAPFPPVASRLISLLSGEDLNFYRIAGVLETDASIAAEVLRLANSPLIGLSREVSTLVQALCILGSARVYSLVMTLSISRFLRNRAAFPAMQWCWRHNLATALVARRIAPKLDADSDRAYTAGLLHDIGRLVLLTVHPLEYNQLIAMSQNDPAFNVLAMEQQWFGIDHAAAGEWLLNEWKLPPPFAQIAGHHNGAGNPRGALETVVIEACSLARRLGFAPEGTMAAAEDAGDLSPELAFQIGDAVNHLECEFRLTGLMAAEIAERPA
jgi:putative nucleotidyltransferase with HDIG domain